MTEEEVLAEKYSLQDVLDNGVGNAKDGSYAEAIRRAFLAGYKAEQEKLEQVEEELADYQFNYPTIKELAQNMRRSK